MEQLTEQQTGTKISVNSIINTALVVVTSIVGISTFLAAMTLPAFPIAHTTGDSPNLVSNFDDCVPRGELIRENGDLVCRYKGARFPQ